MKMKIKNILILSIMLFLFTGITASAETIKIKPEGSQIDLVEIANAGNYLYDIEDDYAIFQFENDVIRIHKNNLFIDVNGTKKLISTEQMGGVILPKYEPIQFSDDSVKINFNFLTKNTKLKINNKTVIINKKETEFEEPEDIEVKKLDINYINEHITDLGYDYSGNYIIDEELLQTIETGNNYIKITTLNETDFQKNNKAMNDLLVETILKLVLNDQYSEVYNAYSLNKSFEKKYGDITAKVWISGDNKIINLEQQELVED